MPKRCALGCLINENSYHKFPHPENNPVRFRAWVHIAGGKLDTPADYELYRKKVICDIHFTDRDRNRNNRLNCLAVPSQHLPGDSDEICTSQKVLLAPEPVNEESSPATFKPTLTGNSDQIDTSEMVILAHEPVNEESSLATYRPTLTGHHHHPLDVHCWTHTDNSTRNITSEHNYCYKEDKGINNNVKKKENDQQPHESPSFLQNQLQTTRRKIKILQSDLTRSQKRNKILGSRIAKARKMSTDIFIFKKLASKMTPAATVFTKMQYTQTRKKPSSRRFTLEEKVLSLSLYNMSPTSYPLLAEFFTLPSTNCLKIGLNQDRRGARSESASEFESEIASE